MTPEITDKDIKEDIERYDKRIMRLKCQLQDIKGVHSRKGRKRVSKLHKEIAHVEGLKRMAVDALNSNRFAQGAKQ